MTVVEKTNSSTTKRIMAKTCAVKSCNKQGYLGGKGTLCGDHLEKSDGFKNAIAAQLKRLHKEKPLFTDQRVVDSICDDNDFKIYSTLPTRKKTRVKTATAIEIGVLSVDTYNRQKENQKSSFRNMKANDPIKYKAKVERSKYWKQNNSYDRSTEKIEKRIEEM